MAGPIPERTTGGGAAGKAPSNAADVELDRVLSRNDCRFVEGNGRGAGPAVHDGDSRLRDRGKLYSGAWCDASPPGTPL